MTVKKNWRKKNPFFKIKFLIFYEPNLTVEIFGFLPKGPKKKANPPDSQQQSKDNIETNSDMGEVQGYYYFNLEKYGCQLR